MILAIILFIAVLALIVIIKARSTSVLQVSNSDLDTVEEEYNIQDDIQKNKKSSQISLPMASFVLGLCSLFFGILSIYEPDEPDFSFFGVLTFILSILSIILGGDSIYNSYHLGQKKDPFALAGLILGIIFGILFLFCTSFFISF